MVETEKWFGEFWFGTGDDTVLISASGRYGSDMGADEISDALAEKASRVYTLEYGRDAALDIVDWSIALVVR